ncbi:Rab44 [Columba guinea]|nr:Rab44 [Columba guinea]
MAERRAAGKSRRLGSSRRKQLHNSSGETPAPAPSPGEEPPWASEIVQRVQELLRERDKEQAGFITRSDMQKLQEEGFPCSTEELELIFDGLDAAGTGRLSTEEFTAGLRQFLSSQKAARDHRRRKTASRRVRLAIPSVMLEGADSEEQRHFAAFMDQLGTENISEEQEIWQLWVKLQQDEPQLLGNLEEFLAKMRHRIQEARSKKDALEKTLNKCVAEHEQEVQQLCETLEQQIQEERQRLQQESMARSHQHSVELQRALDASEREVQRLVMAQMELETRCRSLRNTQQAASAENRQLEESNRVLEDRLRLLHRQLQQTHERLRTTRAAVALEDVEEMGDRVLAELPGEVPLSPQMGPEKSEKHRSEMRIRLGSQSTKPKSTHQVVTVAPDPVVLEEECVSVEVHPWGETSDADVLAAPARHGGSSGAGMEDGEVEGAGVGQGEVAGAGVKPRELENQGADVNGQLIAEVDELKSTPGGSAETDLQQLSEVGSLDTEQGGNMAPDVQPLDQVDKPESVEMVESEDSWADMQLHGGASPESPQGGGVHAAVHLTEEAEDEAQGQGEHGLQQKPVLHPHGVTPGHGEGASGGVQPPEEAESLGRLQDQSTGANVQLLTETDELKPTPGGNMEADLWLWSETSSLDTEQGGNVAPDVQPLAQVDKPELVETVQSEDSWADTQLWEGLSPEGPRQGGAGAAVQIGEEAGDRAPGQGERELLLEPVLDTQAEGAGAGVQVWEEAVMLDMLEDQRTGVNVRLLTEAEELKSTSGGSTGADVAPLGAAGMREGAQRHSPGLEAGLCAAHTVDMCKGNAGECVSPLAEELPHPKHAAAAAEGPVLGALTGPNGQILEGTQTLEMLQGERAEAEERPLDGAQGLEGVQAERLEAGARILAETQSLGIKQGRDDGESVLASPVSKVTLQTSMLKLETMMQEDVLIPDVWQPGLDYQVKNLIVDNRRFALRLWDSAGQERYRSITKQFFRKADGVVLMYDITSEYSFSDVRYWLSCIQEGAEDGVAILLLGNKTDCAAERQVPMEEGERLAKEHQLMFYECSAASGHNVSESMVSFIRLLKDREDKLKNKAEEEPKPPQKKKGCCW